MKISIYGSLMIVAIMISLMIFGIELKRDVALQELNRIANISIRNIGTNLYNETLANTNDENKLRALIQRDLNASSDKMTAEVIVYDYADKIIKVRYTLTYVQLNGTKKSIFTTKSMIIDEFDRKENQYE